MSGTCWSSATLTVTASSYADQVEVLCEVVAERVRDGWAPVAIYDLDTGEQQLVAVEVTAHAFAAPEQEHNPLRPEPRA